MTMFTEFQLMVFEKSDIECTDVVALLGDYQDDELPQALRQRIDDHIEECDYCREMESSYRLVVDLASELPEEEMPVDVQNRFRSNLNKRLGLNLSSIEG